jgi:hypothetical protein
LMKPFIGMCNSGGRNLSARTADKFYQILVEDRERRARDSDRRRTTRRPG